MLEALSGFENGEKKQARHSQFIGALLEKTSKIQREMRGRRYKVSLWSITVIAVLCCKFSLVVTAFRKYKLSYRMQLIR